MQKGKCNQCGLFFREDDVLEVDHIIPKSQGGKDDYKNIQRFYFLRLIQRLPKHIMEASSST
jgi:rubredoxin